MLLSVFINLSCGLWPNRHSSEDNLLLGNINTQDRRAQLRSQQQHNGLILTSVPYLDKAEFASCRIFSLYIWAARLLYLALVSFVEQPCWRKNAVFKEKEKITTSPTQTE